MKTPASILVVGRHPEIMDVILRLLESKAGVRARGVLTDEEALAAIVKDPYDLVIFGGGVNEASRKTLEDRYRAGNRDGRTVVHYGGGSGLLWAELEAAMR